MQRILVMMNRFIGDFLFMVPVLYLLKDHYPEASLEIVINKDCEGLVGPPLVDKVHAFDRSIRTLHGWQRLRRETGFVRRFWRRPYDLVLDLAIHSRNFWIVSMTRAPIKLALGPMFASWHALAYTRIVPAIDPRYETERFLQVPGKGLSLDIAGYLDRIQVPVSEADLESARRYLRDFEISGRFILFAPFSRGVSKYRTWPFEKYAPVLRWVNSRGMIALVLSGPEDGEWIKQLRQVCHEPFVLVKGQTLDCVKGLMRLADALVAIDTGILHLAAAVGLRGVGLWGPTSHKAKTPALRCHIHLEKPYACREGCDRGGWERCNDHRCLGDIGSGEVIAALELLLRDKVPFAGSMVLISESGRNPSADQGKGNGD